MSEGTATLAATAIPKISMMDRTIWRMRPTRAMEDASKSVRILGDGAYEFIDPGSVLGALRDTRFGRTAKLMVLGDFYDPLQWYDNQDQICLRRLRFVASTWEKRFGQLRSSQERIASVRSIAAFCMVIPPDSMLFPSGCTVRCPEKDGAGQHVLIRKNPSKGFEILRGMDIDHDPTILIGIESHVIL